MKNNILRVLLFLVCFPIYSALAEGLYQIEMLVFEQTNKQSLEREWWPENPGSPNLTAQNTPPNFFPPSLLKRPGNVTVLLHKAWQQPIGEATYISNQKDLEGIVSLNSNKLLQASVDLTWQKKMPVVGQKAGLFNVSVQPTASSQEQLISFRLKQSQKIKAEELRYFDHPAFGVLLIIKPV